MSALYTVEHMHAKIPKDAKVTVSAFKAMVVELGTCRLIGNAVLMTDRDWLDFLTAVSARRTRPASPPRHEAGLMVFIGHPYEKDALVLVAWTPLGQELELLDRIREGAQERAMVLATVDATPADVEAFRERHKASWRWGYWYGRTHAFLQDLRRATDGVAPDDEGELIEQSAPEVAD